MYTNEETSLRHWGLGAVVALHLLLFWGLLQMNVIKLPESLSTLTVDLIPPPPQDVKLPEPPKPKPRPVEKRPEPIRQPVMLAAPEESSAPTSAIVPPPPAAIAPLPPIAAPPSPPAPAEVVKPRFDADYLDNPKPVYPSLARRMGEEGRVVLRVQVDAQGVPADLSVQVSSGSARLDQAAYEAVRRWKFVPARRGDEAVSASVLVPIVFSLKG